MTAVSSLTCHVYVLALWLFLQALASVRPPEEKKVEKKEEEEAKPPSPTRRKIETREVCGGCRFMCSCCCSCAVVVGRHEELRGAMPGEPAMRSREVACQMDSLQDRRSVEELAREIHGCPVAPCRRWFDRRVGISVCRAAASDAVVPRTATVVVSKHTRRGKPCHAFIDPC